MADEANDGKRPERCELCRFWVLGDHDIADLSVSVQMGDCRRRAPQMVVAQMERLFIEMCSIPSDPGTLDYDCDSLTKAVWPTTRDWDWCGEFQSARVLPPCGMPSHSEGCDCGGAGGDR